MPTTSFPLRSRSGLLRWVVLPLVLGCSAPVGVSDTACDDAAAHVLGCTGEAPTPGKCDGETAQAILETPCADLAVARADGFWSNLLCSFGIKSHCPGTQQSRTQTTAGDSAQPSESKPAVYSVHGTVFTLGATARVSAAVVHLRGNGMHRTSVTTGDGVFLFTSVPPGSYNLEVISREGSRQTKAVVVSNATPHHVLYVLQ